MFNEYLFFFNLVFGSNFDTSSSIFRYFPSELSTSHALCQLAALQSTKADSLPLVGKVLVGRIAVRASGVAVLWIVCEAVTF